MSEYHKIQTVFKRDMDKPGKPIIDGAWTLPEFEYLAMNEWEFTEKVDGTNIRVIWDGDWVKFGGRTDNASIPAPLLDKLRERFYAPRVAGVFSGNAVMYGEGYGQKIQKGGGLYRKDQDFVLFDVRCGDWWLSRKDIENVAAKLGLDVVPVIGRGTLYSGIDNVRCGFKSAWGDFEAEGIVARPAVELKNRTGNRIITKIKCRDFKR